MDQVIAAVVYRTYDRADANGEFIIRMSSDARDLLHVRKGQYVVVTADPDKPIPGSPTECFRVVAAVRDFSLQDESLPAKGFNISGQLVYAVRLDVTLREAIGVKPCDEQCPVETMPDWARIKVQRLSAKVRTRIAKLLGYQFVVCRVQKALSGDAETPLCRTSSSIIESLGLKDRGLGVVLSPKKQETVRILPLAESYLSHERSKVEAGTSCEEIGCFADFDKYLDRNVKFEWRLPDIHLDFDTRELLGVVPGQPVWVRREPWRLFIEKISLSIAPIILVVLAVLGTVIVEGNFDKLFSFKTAGLTLVLAILAFVALALLGGFEIRTSVKRPRFTSAKLDK